MRTEEALAVQSVIQRSVFCHSILCIRVGVIGSFGGGAGGFLGQMCVCVCARVSVCMCVCASATVSVCQ